MKKEVLMKRIIHLLNLVILLSACTLLADSAPVSQTQAVPQVTPSPGVTLTNSVTPVTPTSTHRITTAPTITNTHTLEPTMTNTPIPMPPGVLSPEEMQGRIDAWINGDIEFTDDERLLDEKTGEIIPLGILARDFGDVNLIFYNLGFTIVNDQNGEQFLIDIAGLEDSQGNRFTFPFHNGKLTDPYPVIHLHILEGRRINREIGISSDQLTPYEFAHRTEDLVLVVNSAVTLEESPGLTGDEGVNYSNRYYVGPKETVRVLADFFQCQDCSIDEVSPELGKFVNVLPSKFNNLIPYLRFYYVSYW